MVLHSIINEYDILMAQDRECRFVADMVNLNPQAVLSTNPYDFLNITSCYKDVCNFTVL